MERECMLHTLTADVVVQADSSVLLVRLESPPNGREGWQLPGGRLHHGEHPERCIRRVLQGLVGLAPDALTLAEVESVPGENWHLHFHYRCDTTQTPLHGVGVQDVRFFQLEHLPSTAHGEWERDVIYRVITA